MFNEDSVHETNSETDVGADVGARLRQLRISHGISQRELARRTGVANATISQIENGGSNPSVGALKRILDGLSVDLAGFFTFELATDERHFYRASELQEIGKDKISYRLVAADRPTRSLQMLYETLQPGADTGKILLSHEGEECGIVLSGSLEITVGEVRQILRKGDAWYFDSTLPHRFRNKGADPCVCVSAGTPATF